MHGTLIDKKLISIVLVAVFMVVSCTSYKVVEPPSIENRVREGNTIRVVTTDGQEVTFKVTAVASDAIEGENQHILFSDIKTIEKQEVHAGKTAGLVAGLLVGAFVMVFGIAYLMCDICH